MRRHKYIFILLTSIYLSFIFYACKKDNPKNGNPPATTPYPIPSIPNFRALPTNTNNPMTVEGVALGKKLFFDPIYPKTPAFLAQVAISLLTVFPMPDLEVLA